MPSSVSHCCVMKEVSVAFDASDELWGFGLRVWGLGGECGGCPLNFSPYFLSSSRSKTCFLMLKCDRARTEV